jgi:leucyl-tRNA synthetase
MEKYNHKEIEKKWREDWKKKSLYKTKNDAKNREYILVEFPYPSGNLHVGHWYAFAVTDIYARYRKMIGKNVLFPIGFDSFGLPAENAAIKNNVNPREWTNSNIATMEKQLESMGAMFDWDRKVATSDPNYYKWTQWLFIQLFNAGLVEKKTTLVNWDPVDKTVLANEQVSADGIADRSGAKVEKKELEQWSIKITNYAEKLLEGLEGLDWPEHIKEAQKNWIGKSKGAYLTFPILNSEKEIKVFTTRPDTTFGITYLVLAPENKIIDEFKDRISNWNEIEEYRKKSGAKTELQRIQEAKEKTGVKIEGLTAKHPALDKELPIFISDYVIASYGTGAVMAVPAHDERDYEFARKFDLPIKEVIKGGNILEGAYEGHGEIVNSEKYNGMDSKEALSAITEDLGEETTTYKIRDWSVSRQRYWGCPIPVVHCEKCGIVPVDEKDLPVKLPDLDDFTPSDDGKSPLSKKEDWVKTKCPKCGGDCLRETDTLDTFIDSSWYFMRYLDPNNEKEFCSKEKQKNWMPVDFYSGGSEHTTMHLLYSRFFQKALFDLGLVEDSEPYVYRNNRGLILGEDGNKMSKSKGNVIDPDSLVEKLGADTVRAYLAFIGPYNEAGSYPWDPNGVVGTRRFIERVVALGEKVGKSDSEEVIKLLHKTIKGVGEDMQALKFNTAISKMMVLSNLMEKDDFSKETYKILIQLFAPVAPYVCEELWSQQGEKESVHASKWPEFDENKTKDKEIQLVVQVNGKFRQRLKIEAGLADEEVKKTVKNAHEMKKWISGKKIRKTIYIKDRLLNFVVEE